MTPDRTKAARELLAFYLEAGVDGALGEQPINHFGPEESAATFATGSAGATPQPAPTGPRARLPEPRTAAAAATNVTPAPGPSLALSPDTAVMAAREAAKRAASLDELRAIMQGF